MADPQLVSEVTKIVRTVAKLAPGVPVASDALLVEDLGIDSLDLVRISMLMEDHFEVVIDVDEVPNFQTIDDLADYVAKLRSAAAA